LQIVKLAPDGNEATRYPGRIIDIGAPSPWIAARADWVLRQIELDRLQFVPGDTLHEFFSPDDWFNCFSVWSPEGVLRGWYANVTYPTTIDVATQPPVLVWRDLYIDVIAIPDGTVTVRDEDELEASDLAVSDSALHERILQVRDELMRRFSIRAFPFHEGSAHIQKRERTEGHSRS
jgi:protein associated with RNAse G/E